MDVGSTLGLQGTRVLIVDDDLDSLEMLRMVLEFYGTEVFSALSVSQAKTTFTVVQPQLVISDIAMPEEDGYDFIRWVRSLSPESGGHVPAVALTARVSTEEQQQALSAGFNLHLWKPVNLEDLTNVLTSLLRKQANPGSLSG